MSNHHFKCGDIVKLAPLWPNAARAGTLYSVVARLASDGSAPRYQVKAVGETFSRVALEHSMSAVLSPEPDRLNLAVPENIENVFLPVIGAADASPARQAA